MKCDGMHCCPQLYYQIKPHDSAITKNKDIVPQNKKPQKRAGLPAIFKTRSHWIRLDNIINSFSLIQVD